MTTVDWHHMQDEELKCLARRLRMARAATGMTQAEVSDAAHVSQSALSLYEKARREPGVLTVRHLAIAYGASVDWLLGLTDRMG